MSEWPDFKIPSDWSFITIDEIAAKLKAGGTPSRKNKAYFGGDIPFVLIDDMTNGGVYLNSTKETISHEGLDSCSAWIVPENSVLLSMYATIGVTMINTMPVATNQAILAIIPHNNCDREYLSFCLRAHKAHLARLNVESTQKNINKGIVSSFPIPLPPLPEQKKIAHILSTVQQAIEAQERIIQTATELKKALMHKLFTEGLHNEPQKETEIGLVPESWELKAMNEICDLIIDCPHTTPRFSNSGVFIARNFNFKDAQFIPEPAFYTSEDEYLLRVKRATPMPGDVLFSREAPIGEACVIPSNTRLSLGQRTMFLRTKRSHLLPYFLVYSFYSENVRRLMLSTAGGLTLPHLNVGDVRKMLIPVPSLKDQEGIINVLLSVERKKELHRRNLSSRQDLFRTLLYELMTAKIRVHKLEVTL